MAAIGWPRTVDVLCRSLGRIMHGGRLSRAEKGIIKIGRTGAGHGAHWTLKFTSFAQLEKEDEERSRSRTLKAQERCRQQEKAEEEAEACEEREQQERREAFQLL